MEFVTAVPITTDEQGEYGIVANVLENDPIFRDGAKVWLVGGDNGDGFENRQFYGLGRGSQRRVTKWARTDRMENYRCAWIPPPMQPLVSVFRGSRTEVEGWARELNAITRQRRDAKAVLSDKSTHARVRSYREKHGCSIPEAVSAIYREDAMQKLTEARTLEDIKPIIADLIGRVIR